MAVHTYRAGFRWCWSWGSSLSPMPVGNRFIYFAIISPSYGGADTLPRTPVRCVTMRRQVQSISPGQRHCQLTMSSAPWRGSQIDCQGASSSHGSDLVVACASNSFRRSGRRASRNRGMLASPSRGAALSRTAPGGRRSGRWSPSRPHDLRRPSSPAEPQGRD